MLHSKFKISKKKTIGKSNTLLKNTLIATAAVTIGANPILPLLIPAHSMVEAKEITDIWPYENKNVPSEFTVSGSFSKTTAYDFTNPIFPINFNIPASNYYNTPIEYFAVRLSNKNLQNVSFVETKDIKFIGAALYGGTDSDMGGVLKNNQIRKIYWNKSSFYNNNIKIGTYAFDSNLLSSLDLPNKVVSIGIYAFSNNKISRVTGIENVTNIGTGAFMNNELVSLGSDGYVFSLPRNKDFKTITEKSFANNKLTSVVIPENVLTVQREAFINNPLTSIEFENPNTVIERLMLDANTISNNPIIYGRGDKSTAKDYADYVGLRYVNKDYYEYLVEAAEEGLTEEKYDAAYEGVSLLEDSITKQNYLDRLEQIEMSYDIADSVTTSEKSLKRTDYEYAKQQVETIETYAIKQKFNERLETVLLAIETAEYGVIKKEYDELIASGSMSIDKLEEIEKSLSEFELVDTTDITNSLSAERNTAVKNTFKVLKDQILLLEQYPTLQNALKAEKLLSSIEDNYSETVTMPDNSVVTTTKAELKLQFDVLTPPIYAKSAVEIAEKYISREKIDEAYILVANLTDSTLKNDYNSRLSAVEDSLSLLLEQEQKIKKAIEKAEITLSSDDISAISILVEQLPNKYLKEPYYDLIDTLKNKQQIKKVVREIELDGVSYDLVDSLTVLTALLPIDDPNIITYAEQVVKYKALLEQEKANVALINDILNNVNRFDVNSLTIEKYNELAALIRSLSDDTLEKEGFEDELSIMLEQLTDLQTEKKAFDLLKEQIDDLDRVGDLSKTELDAIWSALNQLPNANSVEQLKKHYDDTIAQIAQEQLVVNFNNPENQSPGYIKSSKAVIDSIRDDTLRNNTQFAFNNAVENVITDKIDNLSGIDSDYFKELKGMIDSLDDSSLERTLIQNLDQRANNISRDISNTMNVDDSTDNFITNLQDFISNISDSSIRTSAYNSIDESINKHLSQHFAGATSFSENDIEYLQKFFNTYHNANNFNNYSDNTVKNLLEDYFVNNYTTIINSNSDTTNNNSGDSSNGANNSSTVSSDLKEQIKEVADAQKFLADFGSVDFTNNYKGKVEQKLGDLVQQQIKEIENTTILGNNDLNETIKNLGSLDLGDAKADLLLDLEKALGEQATTVLNQSAKVIEESGDMSLLLELLDLIKNLPDGSIKDHLQEQAANFVEKNVELIQNSAATTEQMNKLKEYVEVSNSPEGNTPNNTGGNSSTGASNPPTLSPSDNTKILESLLADMKGLKNMLELLMQMGDNKQPAANNTLSERELQSLISKMDSKNNSNLTQYVGDKELSEKLTASENKIDVLTNIISELQLELADSKEQLKNIEKKQDEGNTYLEENFISLKAQLMSKDGEVAELKGDMKQTKGISLTLLILMGAYGIVSARNNRKLIQSLEKKTLAELRKDKEKVEEAQNDVAKPEDNVDQENVNEPNHNRK